MPVYKAKNGTWYAKLNYTDKQGQHRQKMKRGFAHKADAAIYARDFLAQATRQSSIGKMPFDNFVAIFQQESAKRQSEHSRQQIAYRLKNHIYGAFSCTLGEVSAAMLQKWADDLLAAYALRTVRNLYTLMRSVFNYAERLYDLHPNPVSRLKAPTKREAKREMQFWTHEEFLRGLPFVKDLKGRTALILLYYSGLRKGELYALTWDDFDGEAIHVNKSLQRIRRQIVITPPKTPSSVRTVLLPRQAILALEVWRQIGRQREETDGKREETGDKREETDGKKEETDDKNAASSSMPAFIFPWSEHFIEKAIREAANGAGIRRIRVHDLRHSHASYLISKGANIKLLSQRLGHANVAETLNTYSHMYPSDERAIVELMNGDSSVDIVGNIPGRS